tara:strand:+ start:6209 stop:6451 length:243 start_codon:yes stop_codon:yes gene_type:complete
MTIETAMMFFGWCTVINFGILFLAAVSLAALRKKILPIHARLFGLDEAVLTQCYFQYLSQYKIAAIVLSLVPYLALKLMS